MVLRLLRALALVLALACLAGACRRSTEDWVDDIDAPDAWHRRMAALALHSVPDEDVERAFRTVLKRGREREGRVIVALEGTMRTLAGRRPDLAQHALCVLPVQRRPERLLLSRILLDQLLGGDASARPALEAYLEVELASPVAEHRAAVQPLREALARLQGSK